MKPPVASIEAAIPFYESVRSFHVVSRSDSPFNYAILGRDGIQIGNGTGALPFDVGCLRRAMPDLVH
jgi:hypothetical protein